MKTIKYTIRRNANGFYVRKEINLTERDCLLFANLAWSHGDNIFAEHASYYFKHLAEYCREHNTDCWSILQLATVKEFDDIKNLSFVSVEIPVIGDYDEINVYSQEYVDVIRFNK